MPFRMKNAPATFQCMINKVIAGLPGCEGYIEDVVAYTETWEEHLHRMKQLFRRLRESQLTVNLADIVGMCSCCILETFSGARPC